MKNKENNINFLGFQAEPEKILKEIDLFSRTKIKKHSSNSNCNKISIRKIIQIKNNIDDGINGIGDIGGGTDCSPCNNGTFELNHKCISCVSGKYTPNDNNSYSNCIECNENEF
eukprot:gene11530-4783_t